MKSINEIMRPILKGLALYLILLITFVIFFNIIGIILCLGTNFPIFNLTTPSTMLGFTISIIWIIIEINNINLKN